MNRTKTILLLALLLSAGCDLVGENGTETTSVTSVYVANQGNFSDGNGSVTVYDPETEVSRASAISGLGSIVQSVALADGRLYVMANSGNRIDVFNAETLEQVAQISDVVSPRYLLADGNTGYVTNLFEAAGSFSGGKVTVLDLKTNSIVTEIDVGSNPEGLALVGNRLYVANHGFGGDSTLSVIDTATKAVIETIDVECDGPRFLAADAEDDVFVFCTGETVWGEEGIVSRSNGAVRVLDGRTGEIIERIAVDGQIGAMGPGQDAFHAEDAETIFVVKESSAILVFDTKDNRQTGSIGPLDGAPIGAVAFDADEGHLFLGRSNGFTAAGEVSIHTRGGEEIGRFTAGIVPTFITFARDE